MKKEINWSKAALIGIGIICIAMAFMPDYTYLFNV